MLEAMRKEIEEAVRLLEQNEPKAMEQALELLQGTVFSFSMKVCGQREDAEDTMQEVLVKSLPALCLPHLARCPQTFMLKEKTVLWSSSRACSIAFGSFCSSSLTAYFNFFFALPPT